LQFDLHAVGAEGEEVGELDGADEALAVHVRVVLSGAASFLQVRALTVLYSEQKNGAGAVMRAARREPCTNADVTCRGAVTKVAG